MPSKEKVGYGEHLTAYTGLGTIKLYQRIEIIDKVMELQADGVSIKGISRVLGISRNTVRLYFIQETLFPKPVPNRQILRFYKIYCKAVQIQMAI